MTILYSLRTEGDGFRIAKFDDDFNVKSDYLLLADPDGRWQCNCPSGVRPSCRHRQMLTLMRERVDSNWFYCFDDGTWHDPLGMAEEGPDEAVSIAKHFTLPDDISSEALCNAWGTILGERPDHVIMGTPVFERESLDDRGEALMAVPDTQPKTVLASEPRQPVPAGRDPDYIPRRKI